MFILGVKHIFNRAFRQFISVLLTALLLQNACADGGQRSAPATESTPPKLALARIYQPVDDLTAYWVSEKLDGVRAYWNGKQLLSRSGRVYHAPAWFVRDFPTRTLDGELWISRGRFEQLVSTVRKHYPVDIEWKQVKYMVFDLPDSPAVFDIRLIELHQLLEKINNPFIELIKQFRVESHQALMHRLDQVIAGNGEGLMLHKGNALYRAGRTSDLLKVKRFDDAEATVIAHLPGKGKYQHMLGALVVETSNGKRFRIGSGFSDAERKNPPPVGSIVTYQYTGFTKKGIPKFAGFLRVR